MKRAMLEGTPPGASVGSDAAGIASSSTGAETAAPTEVAVTSGGAEEGTSPSASVGSDAAGAVASTVEDEDSDL